MAAPVSAVDIEEILRRVPFQPFYPPGAQRGAWQAAASRRPTLAQSLMAQAQQAALSPIPALPASLWLECQRTGQREGYETPCYQRRLLLRDLLLGECLQFEGRFSDALADVLWAICEESSWAYPAHHPHLPDPAQPYIDLGAANTAYDLAVAHSLLAEQLPAGVGARIRYEINQRLFQPFLHGPTPWWLHGTPERPASNWGAVCSGGVMAAAVLLEPDPARLAALLARGIASLHTYLNTFDADGATSEGPGYWNYGFGWFTLIAQHLAQRSAGEIDLLADARCAAIAAYPVRTLLSPGQWLTFSDAQRRAEWISPMLVYLGQRLDLPGLLELAKDPVDPSGGGLSADLCWRLPALFWDMAPPGPARLVLAAHDWSGEMQTMIARSDPANPRALVLAAKGGHNDELHNHNDVGTFIVQFNEEALICDPGSGRYTLDYFGEQRYQHFAASSLGHSVPLVNGCLQAAGRAYAADVIEHDSSETHDILRLDLRAAYPPQAGLAHLERRLRLLRPNTSRFPLGAVELEDHFAFESGPDSFESALITFGQAQVDGAGVVIRGQRASLRVAYDGGEDWDVRLEMHADVALADGPQDVTRVVFALRSPRVSGCLRLRITPED